MATRAEIRAAVLAVRKAIDDIDGDLASAAAALAELADNLDACVVCGKPGVVRLNGEWMCVPHNSEAMFG